MQTTISSKFQVVIPKSVRERLKLRPKKKLTVIEDSPWQATGNLHRKEHDYFYIRSLTPPQAAGNALP